MKEDNGGQKMNYNIKEDDTMIDYINILDGITTENLKGFFCRLAESAVSN